MFLWNARAEADTDPVKINELLTRAVERVYPTREALEEKLKSGARLSLYFGIDPTGPFLHLGHAVNLLVLRRFQDLGHAVIILYGGFTAQIGDPTDKLAARQPLTSLQIKQNTKDYKKAIGKILDLKRGNVRFLDNQKWSNKLKPKDLLDLASQFTVSQLLERDMFQERIKQGKEIHVHEFLYPIFQAYDAVTMGVDIQIGGNDQTFNMLAGRTLMRKIKHKEKFVMTIKLLVDPDGKKMGKTEGNMIPLSDSAGEMYGKVMSWGDGMILRGFELCTKMPMEEIAAVEKSLKSGANPKEAKMKLARAIAALYHGEEAAKKAETNFIKTFQEGKPEEFVEVIISGKDIAEALIEKKIIASTSELRRLISEKALTSLETGEKMGEAFLHAAPAGKYRIGKHRFFKVIIHRKRV